MTNFNVQTLKTMTDFNAKLIWTSVQQNVQVCDRNMKHEPTTMCIYSRSCMLLLIPIKEEFAHLSDNCHCHYGNFVRLGSQGQTVRILDRRIQDAWRNYRIFSNNGGQNERNLSGASLGLLDGVYLVMGGRDQLLNLVHLDVAHSKISEGVLLGRGQPLNLVHLKVVQWKILKSSNQMRSSCSSVLG